MDVDWGRLAIARTLLRRTRTRGSGNRCRKRPRPAVRQCGASGSGIATACACLGVGGIGMDETGPWAVSEPEPPSPKGGSDLRPGEGPPMSLDGGLSQLAYGQHDNALMVRFD